MLSAIASTPDCSLSLSRARAAAWKVGQLLSKEGMHEPMRHLHAEFPRYLETHASALSSEDLCRYTKQQKLVARILAIYDETPSDTDQVATLMQEMQACGPPPPEIAGPVADGVGCTVS